MLLGKGDGTVQPQVTYAVSSGPVAAIAAGDFTGNGHVDLAVANGDGTVSVLLGKGDGTFQPQVTYAVGGKPAAHRVAGDFNGDGRLDLAAFGADSTRTSEVSILLGNGDGTFQSQATYAVGSSPGAIVADDFTGDGHTRPAWPSRTYSTPLECRARCRDAAGATATVPSSPPETVTLGTLGLTPISLIAVGISTATDGPTWPSQGTTPAPMGRIGAYWATATAHSSRHTKRGITWSGLPQTAVVAGDFNGDGRLDLAVANLFAGTVSSAAGQRRRHLPARIHLRRRSRCPDAIVAGDFNGDGRLDLAVTNLGDNTVSVLLGNGDGTFRPQVTYAVGSAPDGIVAGDFTGDRHLDLAVANAGGNTVSVLLGNGDGTFQAQVTYTVGSFPEGIVAGDFTGNGRLDLAVANWLDNTVSVLLGNGDGTFQPQVTYAVGSHPVAIVAGDFTGDGHIDLAVANENDKTVSVLLGNGDGNFAPQVTYAVNMSGSDLTPSWPGISPATAGSTWLCHGTRTTPSPT